MRCRWLYSWITLLLPLPIFAAGPSVVDQLPQSALQSAFQILRRDYIRRDELTMEELNRAALAGLLERLSFGARLVQLGGEKEKAAPYVHCEFLAPDIAYVRPETCGEGESALFEKAIEGVSAKQARHLILDLRGASTQGLFEEAGAMLQCFVPAGELMFKMKQIGKQDAELYISKRDPLWKGPVLVLVDEESNNAAEAMAACLKYRGAALLIGSRTRGAAVRYSDVQLDGQTFLRYASAEMLLPDGSSVFGHGLVPSVLVGTSMEEKHKAFARSRGQSMKPYIVDRVRPRFNERALVTGSNPELDDYVRRYLGQPLPGDEGQVRDVVAQRAVDLLQSADFSEQAKLPWNGGGSLIVDPAPVQEDVVPKAIPVAPSPSLKP